jgi:hypothetical protein
MGEKIAWRLELPGFSGHLSDEADVHRVMVLSTFLALGAIDCSRLKGSHGLGRFIGGSASGIPALSPTGSCYAP